MKGRGISRRHQRDVAKEKGKNKNKQPEGQHKISLDIAMLSDVVAKTTLRCPGYIDVACER